MHERKQLVKALDRLLQVLDLVEKKKGQCEYVVIDTPGQIEVFTWSASGNIITEALAAQFPTIIVYVMDTVRSTNPVTFMSNMLYACSILYKTKLPFVIAMNKTDVIDHKYAVDWMEDFETFQVFTNRPRNYLCRPYISIVVNFYPFQESLQSETSYVANLAQSLSLALEEFYANIRTVGVSAMTGHGIPAFLEAINEAKIEYDTEYKVEYERLRVEKEEAEKKASEDRLKEDESDKGEGTSLVHSMRMETLESEVYLRHPGDDEEDDEGEEEGEDRGELIEEDTFNTYVKRHNDQAKGKAAETSTVK